MLRNEGAPFFQVLSLPYFGIELSELEALKKKLAQGTIGGAEGTEDVHEMMACLQEMSGELGMDYKEQLAEATDQLQHDTRWVVLQGDQAVDEAYGARSRE